MEIKDILQGISAGLNTKSVKKDDSTGQDFQNILERSSAKMTEETGSPVSNGVEKVGFDPMAPLSAAYVSAMNDVGSIQTQCVQSAEKTLNLLEKYQEAIGNLEMPLKEISPLIQSLSQEVKDLDLLSEKLPSSDPLKEIVSGVGVVSAVEVEKFHRGEYI